MPMKSTRLFLLSVAVWCGLVAHGAAELVLAERGKPAASTIVVADGAPPSLKYVAEELQRYVKELTGPTMGATP